MIVWFSVLASLALVPILLQIWAPYFLHDCYFFLKAFRFAQRLKRYRKNCYTILDKFVDHVKSQPHKAFILFEDEEYTYLEVDKQSNKVARALKAHAGLKEGDTVALFLGNEPRYVWMWLGLAKLGCTTSLLNYNIRSKSLLHCFYCCGANTLIAGEELKDAVKEVWAELQEKNISVFILADNCDIEGLKPINDEIRQSSDEPVPFTWRSNITIRSPSVYIYTSGTTGLPKAALITQERMLRGASLQYMAEVTSEDIVYVNLPLYHSAGFLIGVIGSIDKGNTVVLRRKFSASQFWNDCQKYNVTVIQYIGETVRYLCNTPKKDNEREHRVRVAIGNGIRADVWKEFLTRFGDIKIWEFYAATEGNIGFMNSWGNIGAVGRANYFHWKMYPYTLIKYDTENDEPVRNANGLCVEVQKGETGLLVVKITTLAPFVGYAQNEQQTEKKKLCNVLQKGDLYFNSGDLLRIDQNNFIYFQDRVGDTFRWKGENVATTEVSDLLTMVDCIEEANVYGVKVPGHEGKAGMAAVTLKDGKTFDSSRVYTHVVSYLPSYAQPRFFRIQTTLEVTATFKQMKVNLVKEGFDPATIADPLYYLDDQKKSYVPMTHEIYTSIVSGKYRF